MPEGDTIHKLAGYLAPRLEGRRLAGYEERLVAECDRVILCTEPECDLLRGRLDDPAAAARVRAAGARS